MADLQDGVSLTDLTVITRWSLAVRQPEAERADLIEALRADLAWLEGGRRRPSTLPSLRRSTPAREEAAAEAAESDGEDKPVKSALRRTPAPRRTTS